jgi:Capsule assembly protein Wzi
MKGTICVVLAGLLAGTVASAGEPWVAPGNLQVRHDIQLLVDDGVIDIPLSHWPIATADLAQALAAAERKYGLARESGGAEGESGAQAGEKASEKATWGFTLSNAQFAALTRLRVIAARETTGFFGELSGAARPQVLRTFRNEPRAEYGVTVGYAGISNEHFGGRLELTVVDSPPDGDNFRLDGSYVTGRLGNWLVTLGAQDRWWGSGWQGSLILGNNARPVPAIALDRAESLPFESKWLRWIGPWRLTTFLGYMEGDRDDYDHPLLFGARIAARPLQGLEISFERTAQFCGEGRSCTWSDFWNLWWGNDNAGENVDADDEPGNQLAGWDVRWASPIGNWPYAIYWQHTGETIDNQLYRPYRSLELGGAEVWGDLDSGGSWRLNFEWADTLCGGTENEKKLWDCAYNSNIFNPDGYRYKGRVMGHSIDGDSVQYGLRYLLLPADEGSWSFMLRYSQLNRDGAFPDPRNSVAPGPENWWSYDVSYRRPVAKGWVEIGVGMDQEDRKWDDETALLPRGTITWHRGF